MNGIKIQANIIQYLCNTETLCALAAHYTKPALNFCQHLMQSRAAAISATTPSFHHTTCVSFRKAARLIENDELKEKKEKKEKKQKRPGETKTSIERSRAYRDQTSKRAHQSGEAHPSSIAKVTRQDRTGSIRNESEELCTFSGVVPRLVFIMPK